MPFKPHIRRFIVENFLYGHDDGVLDNDSSLLENGVIDSTGILELVSFIEEKYVISIKDEELIPENFDSIGKISTFIERKIGGKRKLCPGIV